MKTKAKRLLAFLQALFLLLSLSLPTAATETEESGVLGALVEDVIHRFSGPMVHDAPPDLPLSGNPQIEALLECAINEHGYSYQADGTTKYGIWYGYPREAWCAMFISWCANQVGIGENIIQKTAATDAEWYGKNGTLHYFFEPWLDNKQQNAIKEHGIFTSRADYTPQRGDLIYIKWNDSPYSITFAHVGLVLGVKDGRVYTVEGNSGSGVVRYKSYELTNSVIRAYGTPNYTPTEPYRTAFYEVRAGEGLALREGPTTSSLTLTTIPNKTVLRISQVHDNTWGLVTYDGMSGYVPLAFTKYHSDIEMTAIQAPSTFILAPGHSFPVSATVLPEDTTDKTLFYRSSDPNVFTVDENGTITPVSPGKATLTIQGAVGVTHEAQISVTPSVTPGTFSDWVSILPPASPTAERTVEEMQVWRDRLYHDLYAETEGLPEGYEDLGIHIAYGDWSAPLTTREPITESDTVELISKATYYTYFHYHNYYEDGGRGIDSIHTGTGAESYDETTITYVLPESPIPDKGGQQAYRHDSHNCPLGYRVYFLKGSYTEYTYRTRTKETSYHYLLSTPWSDWSETKPDQTEHRQIEALTLYRYRDNEVTSLTLLTPPAITQVNARTEIDTTGLSFLVTYADGSEKTLDSGFTLSGFDPESEGTQTITLTYLGQSLTFDITVIDPTPIKITSEGAMGIWRETLTLPFDIQNNHGLVSYRIFLTYDPVALTPIGVTSAQGGNIVFSIPEPGKIELLFTTEEQIKKEGLLFSLDLTINREADLRSYPITLSYEPNDTLRLQDKPIRLVLSDTYLTVLPETEHTYVSTVAQAPTCTVEGILQYTCKTCDDTYTEPIPKVAHTLTETVERQPTCTEEGLKAISCQGCDLRQEEPIPTVQHALVETIERQPTCTVEGLKVTSCAGCGERHEESIPMVAHTFTETIERQPTCTVEGLKVTSCSACDLRQEESIPAPGHTLTQWTQSKVPTCTEDGENARTCTVCAEIEHQSVPALGHTYVSTVIPPTKKDDGYTEHICQVCTDTYRDAVTQALGYKIEFLDHDGSVILSYIAKFDQPITSPQTDPVRAQTAQYTYTFAGYEGYLDGMTAQSDITFRATYRSELRSWRVIFRDEDGNVYSDKVLPYGTVIIPPESLAHPEDRYYSFHFVGYLGYREGMTVTGDHTFQVTFHKEAKYPDHIESDIFHVDQTNGIVTGIDQKTTVSDLLSGMEQSEFLTVYHGSTPLSGDSTVASGMTLAIVGDTGIVDEVTLVVTGDVSGDGKLSLTDYVRLKSHLLGKSELEGAYLAAADLNGDGKISLTDYVRMKSILLGKS